MRRKLYFVLPDVNSAREIMNELLPKCFDAKSIHYYAQPEDRLNNLSRGNTAEKTDMVHCLGIGIALGAVLGAVMGLLAIMFPPLACSLLQGHFIEGHYCHRCDCRC